MRIVMVSQMTLYLLCYDGFGVDLAHLIRELSARHELQLLAVADGTESASQLEWPRPDCRSVEVVRRTRPRGRWPESPVNKIIEAIALGTPMVATPKTLTGAPLVHGTHLLIGETGNELAEATLSLLDQKEPGPTLSKEARRLVELAYSWTAIVAKFEELYWGDR